ncbi:MAG: RNB domain-containing ribonuclease [Anaerolineaceae bacterium]|nr:RNB domain-containing ribonuclease [Anaerolineaceae bacterium]
MDHNENKHRAILTRIAHQAMIDRGLQPDFSAAVEKELSRISGPAEQDGQKLRNLKHLLWSSIDNDDSLDIDQLTAAEILPDGSTILYVAIADVDALVKKESAIDQHASHNTTSVYTSAVIFPMLPEQLSTGYTSLNVQSERIALVIEMHINANGVLVDEDVYRAVVFSHAKLAYNSVAAWLDEKIDTPQAILAVKGMADNIRLQDTVAQRMHQFRHQQGALSLETIESHPLFVGDQLQGLEVDKKNRAKAIVEDFMITANGVVARFLSRNQFPSIRRVVRSPKRWERIVELAAEYEYSLPETPDSKALEKFLTLQRKKDPLRFPDVSLSVIKLLGAGEYMAEHPGDEAPGHFGLAVKDYTHSTAPNRRFTDLITHRLVKAVLDQQPNPYRMVELEALARQCTLQENAVNKVERQVSKSAAALLFASKIGEEFNAIVTGAASKGTWVRLLDIPIEGKLVSGYEHVDVGHRVRVQLESVDVDRGYIDFKKI